MPQALYPTDDRDKDTDRDEVAATNAERKRKSTIITIVDPTMDTNKSHEGTYRVSTTFERSAIRRIETLSEDPARKRNTSSTSFPSYDMRPCISHGKDDRFLAVVRYIAIGRDIPHDTASQADHAAVASASRIWFRLPPSRGWRSRKVDGMSKPPFSKERRRW